MKKKIASIAIGSSETLEWELTYEEIIEQYGLDEALAGKEDIDLMKAALVWEEGILNHISNHITDERDIESLLNDGVVSNLNCRGLSLVLSQVLRMYGVKAQIIGCMPYADMSSDCHIIVRAYSEELEKWVMLVSGNYEKACDLSEECGMIITTNAEKFWK